MDRLINDQYEESLVREYDKLTKNDKKGFPSIDYLNKPISNEEVEDNEDTLIQLCHYKFLAGLDKEQFNYDEIDNEE